LDACWAPASAVALSLVYVLARRLYALERRHGRAWLSFAAGSAVAYVFMDMLPELAERHRGFVAGREGDLLFAAQRIYAMALLGFVTFYGLDHFVLRRVKGGRADGGEGAAGRAFWLHVSGFAAYSWLVGYLLVDRAAFGGPPLALYATAMAFHFTVIDSGLMREHGRAYDRVGRWVLAASVIAGVLVGWAVVLPETTVSRLFAFLAGGVVLTSVNEELPRDRQGRFLWFALGATVYSAVLALALHKRVTTGGHDGARPSLRTFPVFPYVTSFVLDPLFFLLVIELQRLRRAHEARQLDEGPRGPDRAFVIENEDRGVRCDLKPGTGQLTFVADGDHAFLFHVIGRAAAGQMLTWTAWSHELDQRNLPAPCARSRGGKFARRTVAAVVRGLSERDDRRRPVVAREPQIPPARCSERDLRRFIAHSCRQARRDHAHNRLGPRAAE
jgi:hypothetical protein